MKSRLFLFIVLLFSTSAISQSLSLGSGGIPLGPQGLPLSNPAYSGILSGPVGQFGGQTQLPNFYDWRLAGPVTPGVTDQSANVTNAWNSVSSLSTTGLLPVGNIPLASTVQPASARQGYAQLGLGGSGESVSGTNFIWSGGASTAFLLDRQRDSIIGPFMINLEGVSGASGLKMTSLSTTSGGISTHNTIQYVNVRQLTGSGATGIGIGGYTNNVDTNNEAMTFWKPTVTTGGSFYDTGSKCFADDGFNNGRAEDFYEVLAYGCGTAFDLGAKSSLVLGGLTEGHNLVANINGGTNGNTVLQYVYDESSKQGAVTSGNTLLIGNVYQMDAPDTTKPWWDFSGSLATAITFGNVFGQAWTGSTPSLAAVPNNGRWVSIADNLGAVTPPMWPGLGYGTGLVFGTANSYGDADLLTIHSAQTEGTYGVNAGGIFLGASAADGFYSNIIHPSPPLTLSAATATSGCRVVGTVHSWSASWCNVPFTFQAVLSGYAVNSAATLKLEPPTDPLTGVTWGGQMNFDFQTNSNGGLFMAAHYVETLHTPASSSEACTTGQFTDDASYHYVCTATNTWKRVALSAF